MGVMFKTPVSHVLHVTELLFFTGVDLEIYAHEHSYERMWPIYNYTVRLRSELHFIVKSVILISVMIYKTVYFRYELTYVIRQFTVIFRGIVFKITLLSPDSPDYLIRHIQLSYHMNNAWPSTN